MGIRLGSFVSQKTFILYTHVTMWASMRICNSVLCWIIRKNNEFLLQPVGIIYLKSILLLILTWSFYSNIISKYQTLIIVYLWMLLLDILDQTLWTFGNAFLTKNTELWLWFAFNYVIKNNCCPLGVSLQLQKPHNSLLTAITHPWIR